MNGIRPSDWLPEWARWGLSCPFMISIGPTRKKLSFWPYNKSFIDQASLVMMAHYPRSFLRYNHKEGDMGVYGIVVLGFFSCGISVILILKCGIAVSSSSAVCGFSSFWLTVFSEIRLFTVLRYHLFALSFRYNARNKMQ